MNDMQVILADLILVPRVGDVGAERARLVCCLRHLAQRGVWVRACHPMKKRRTLKSTSLIIHSTCRRETQRIRTASWMSALCMCIEQVTN